MFTKQEIKTRWAEYCADEVAKGNSKPEAGLGLATLIMSSSLLKQKQRNGYDYAGHPITVSQEGTRSETKRIIGMLHDVPEDTDWTLDELLEIGFSKRVVRGVDGVTKRDGELYFDFIERCGRSGADAIDIKLDDLEHNSQLLRNPSIEKTEKQIWKEKAYNISNYYLVAIKKGKIDPSTKIEHFIKITPQYAQHPEMVAECLKKFSSRAQLNDNKKLKASFAK